MLTNRQRLASLSRNVLSRYLSRSNFAMVRQAEKTDKTEGLSVKLEGEISQAEASYEPVKQNEKEAFLNTNRWVLLDNEDSMNLELKKSTGEFDISVKFSSNPPQITQDDDEPGDKFVDFYVTITRNNKPQGLFVEAVTTTDSSVNINQIHLSNDVNEYAKKFLSSNVVDCYTGPEFVTLDEKLQQEFLDLFVGLGINDELGSFIEVMSVDKDERLLINWMKKVKNSLI